MLREEDRDVTALLTLGQKASSSSSSASSSVRSSVPCAASVSAVTTTVTTTVTASPFYTTTTLATTSTSRITTISTIPTVLSSPSPSPSSSFNNTLPADCTCTYGAPGGFYCGYCSQVTSCVRGDACWSCAFLCGSQQCGNYGMLEYCAATGEGRLEKENCPFLGVKFGKGV